MTFAFLNENIFLTSIALRGLSSGGTGGQVGAWTGC